MSIMIGHVNQFVAGLKSRSEDVRFKTANELHHYVTTELREMSPEDVSAFMEEFHHHIFEMVSSSDVNEKKGGILAIVNLLEVDSGNTGSRISRFANYLRNLLPSNDTTVTELAAYAIGRLTTVGSSFTAEYDDFVIKRAIEWLCEERHEGKRHAAVLILQELAISTPTFFFQNIQPIFRLHLQRRARPQAHDPRGRRRETKDTQNPPWYSKSYEEAESGFEEALSGAREKGMNREDRIHGSLLVINELLKCSNIEGERAMQELEEVNSQQARHDRPSNAKLGSRWVAHAITQGTPADARTPAAGGSARAALLRYHRAQGFQPASVVSLHQGSSHQPHGSHRLHHHGRRLVPTHESNTCKRLLEEKFDQICERVLRQRSLRNTCIQTALHQVLPRLAAFQTQRFVRRERERSYAFLSIGLLAVAVGEHLLPYLPRIMEVIRVSLPSNSTPSNPALTAALQEVSLRIPQLKRDIQDGLLKMLSCILMQRPLKHPGVPTKHSHTAQPSQGRTLTSFVKHCANTYLTSEHKEIRLEAVRTCCCLLSPALQPTLSEIAKGSHRGFSVSVLGVFGWCN
ncbi:hypothetical protein HPB48_005814 [Haemaphysalis longicornis]|uniref:Target of rapamycin n=1 Tax=Haemaphysalis longicornis TaxID=44386 RepID=A0A9J6GMI3_HAELO|nr:hypothetical protein HPB48_005814 [Haemaphysalis longicornis]